ncbi:MAG: PEP-CTERM sorting domain-containing protein [Fimbriimonadaceae bacterium]|nr:PEP-CTERM sorting domain-containing protein [Fimbriimonadaceae bacterium]
MKKTLSLMGVVALTVAASSSQAVTHNFESLSEGFLGTTWSSDGITYRDVNNVSGGFPDGNTFGPGDLGDQLIIEDATLFFNDFPGYGSPNNVLTFGSAFVPGGNLSIGALASVFIDVAFPADSASLDIAFYENGPWGGMVYHLDALLGGNVVSSDSFTISDLGGRDNATWTTMSVSGASFDTLQLYATWNGEYTAPRGMIDNVTVNSPVPEPASMAVLGIGALALIRKRRAKKA